ncbi:23S rRNA (uracil(1939)-C(5))-methyltransferase RlmD [Mycoplasmopsis glycophila]|uniref:Hypothetical RNA methyltransferase n=1 Tax=Mycoplasmopsis glycophila TaxID=171285 RepID=A0A449AW25_9BACT|nr:23S rRNA (uracil(1939)-C(5))-methyltransferase RlmD [Mycoplasmopsis glycophila]VEU70858.1 Hypothetical RNA methyltransferase [Mycoplasmopsis glycophila]
MFAKPNLNDELIVECNEISYEGLGVVKFENFTIFVYDLFPGEKAKIKLFKTQSKIAFGYVLELLTKSSSRTNVLLNTVFSAPLINLKYSEQIKFKNDYLFNLLQRNLKTDLTQSGIYQEFTSSLAQYNYRNKIRYDLSFNSTREKLEAIEYFPKSKTKIPINNQKLNKQVLNDLLAQFLELINQVVLDKNKLNLYQTITLRTNNENKVSVLLKIHNDYDLPQKLVTKLQEIPNLIELSVEKKNQIKTIFQKEEFKLELNDKLFEIKQNSFFQINNEVASKIFDKVKKLNNNSYDYFIDLFCGVGVISILSALENQKVIGIDNEASSIQKAKQNALNNNLKDFKYICGDAFKIISKEYQNWKNPLFVVDPPRAGLGIDFVKWIAKQKIHNIIYISCDPRTLTRDLQEFEKQKYSIKKIQGFDMFPNTHHIETVVVLEK